MGVSYKLTDDIVQFILEQKQKAPDMSCRELVEGIETTFQRDVSKSSVHEVLKQAHIASPRGRKFKSKFAIPPQKKAQILASLSIISPLLAGGARGGEVLIEDKITAGGETLIENKSKNTSVILKPLQKGDTNVDIAPIIHQAFISDLFAKEIEAPYHQIQISGFKLELQDECQVFIDARFKGLYAQAPQRDDLTAPIERALSEVADYFINNLQPIIIKEFSEHQLNATMYDFLLACSNVGAKRITKVTLLDAQQRDIAEFTQIIDRKKDFIIGVQSQMAEIKEFMEIKAEHIQTVQSHLYPEPIQYMAYPFSWKANHTSSLYIIALPPSLVKEGSGGVLPIISNIQEAQAGDVVRMYVERHVAFAPLPCPPRTEGGKKVDFEDIVKDLKGRLEFNEHVKIVNVDIPKGYDNLDKLTDILNQVNALCVKDQDGRRVWMRAVTEKI